MIVNFLTVSLNKGIVTQGSLQNKCQLAAI